MTDSAMPGCIGPYEIAREIGRGGMGVVYLAHDAKLDRPVAIKAIADDFAEDPERLARFEREARVLASLSHGNIATVYGLEEADGHRFLRRCLHKDRRHRRCAHRARGGRGSACGRMPPSCATPPR